MIALPRRGVGLLGGSFDPIHKGHLAIANQAYHALQLVRVDFLPTGQPWQKKITTTAQDRLQMIQKAIQGLPQFGINTHELESLKTSYTIDTLQSIRAKLGSAVPLVLIIGSDQWLNLSTWHRWQSMLSLANIAIGCRANAPWQAHQLDDVQRLWMQQNQVTPQTLTSYASGKITFFDAPQVAISSSYIRNVLLHTSPTDALTRLENALTVDVAQYIFQKNLYTLMPTRVAHGK